MALDWENMADADWKWVGRPLEELSHKELVAALITAGKMYYRMSDLYHEQCEALAKCKQVAI